MPIGHVEMETLGKRLDAPDFSRKVAKSADQSEVEHFNIAIHSKVTQYQNSTISRDG